MATNTITLLTPTAYISGSNTWAQVSDSTAAGTIIKQISIVNVGATTETVELGIHTAAPTASERTVYKVVLGVGESAHFNGTWVLDTTYELYGRTTTGSSVTISVHGMDMT
jgi:hypothetical protein